MGLSQLVSYLCLVDGYSSHTKKKKGGKKSSIDSRETCKSTQIFIVSTEAGEIIIPLEESIIKMWRLFVTS